jgi:redox-regulated HSP33 family molecular chaperone
MIKKSGNVTISVQGKGKVLVNVNESGSIKQLAQQAMRKLRSEHIQQFSKLKSNLIIRMKNGEGRFALKKEFMLKMNKLNGETKLKRKIIQRDIEKLANSLKVL